MQSKIRKFFFLAFSVLFFVTLLPVSILAETPATLLISKIKTGPGADEYVEVFNPGSQTLDASQGNWRIEYLSASHDGSLTPTRNIYVFTNETIGPESFFVVKHSSFVLEGTDGNFAVNTGGGSLAKTGGTIRIMNADGVVDIVGWGSAAQYENKAAFSDEAAPMSRCFLTQTGPMVDSGDNFKDFLQYEPTSLRSVPLCAEPSDPDPGGGMGGGTGDPTSNSCAGIIITEILPNPSGSDAGREFIELYNPTSHTISLEGCKLETSANSTVFIFGKIDIKSKQYLAFYDEITGLSLTNSSGGSVYLVDTDDSEQEIKYPADLDDDVVWALDLSSNGWTFTYMPTPGAKNEIVEVKPCLEGQFRNEETNRCNKIVAEVRLAPCPAGKFRNPETNRCKSILDAASQLKACKSGQFRNPETNRCKSLSSSQSLVPCKPGQERNPETNRCRKTGGAESGVSSVKDVLSTSDLQNRTSWAVAGFSFTGASIYAIWEWRNELLEKLLGLKNKLGLK